MQTALTECAAHVGVRVVDAIVMASNLVLSSPSPSFILESFGPASSIVGTGHNFTLTDPAGEFIVRGLSWRPPTGSVGTVPFILMLSACGCVQFEHNTVQSISTLQMQALVYITSLCSPEPTLPVSCRNTIKSNIIADAYASGIIAQYNSVLDLDTLLCARIPTSCVRILRSDLELLVRNIAASECGDGTGQCLFLSGIPAPSPRIPLLQTPVSNISHASAFTATPSTSNPTASASILISDVTISTAASAAFSGISTPDVFASGLVLQRIPQIEADVGNPSAVEEYLRVVWLTNRAIASSQKRDTRYVPVSATPTDCGDGCSIPIQFEFATDAAFTSPVTSPQFFQDGDIIHLRLTLNTATPTRYAFSVLYLVACSSSSTISSYNAMFPASTGCVLAPAGQKTVLVNAGVATGPASLAPGGQSAAQVITLPANPIIAPPQDVTFHVVYDVADLVESRVFALTTTPPTALDTQLNPSSSGSAVRIVRCPLNQAPVIGSSNPVQCQTASVPDTPDDDGGVNPILILAIVGGTIGLCLLIFIFGAQRRQQSALTPYFPVGARRRRNSNDAMAQQEQAPLVRPSSPKQSEAPKSTSVAINFHNLAHQIALRNFEYQPD